MKILKISVAVILGLYLLAMGAFFTFQRSFLYYPSESYVTLNDAHADSAFKELAIKTADGIELTDWYAPATSKKFTFVFFHGNGDNLASASRLARPYIDAGYGFVIAEYRGYSGFKGSPTEYGLYADARACINALVSQGVKSDDIILYGHSLGTGVATQMATEFHVGGVMLLAPYISIAEMAQIQFPYFPSKYLALDRFDNAQKINSIHAPILIVNGTRDGIIPPSQGETLYSLSNEPHEFHSIPGHGHNDLFDDFAPLSLKWADKLNVTQQ
jgi:fermentation-respiration switch protein FrsA (DUF1100 family)